MAESVYISSTFNDLKNFRQAVINCIVSLGDYYQPVSMEFYDAEDIHFVEKCLNDVEACDIYILVLGKRYGYIPKGFSKSITEMEYEKAREMQKKGTVKQVLVFKVSDTCLTYVYKENDPAFIAYQQEFLDEVNERLSPRPFDSEAELCLQVSHALMKRLFKLIRSGKQVIPPDKDSVLCYCDRNVPIRDMKKSVFVNNKRIFFLQGNRRTDVPGGLVKRFAKYSLGAVSKIEPMLKITDLFSSNDPESNDMSAFLGIIEYFNISFDEADMKVEGFIKELERMKRPKVIVPFYFDFEFDEDADKFSEFFRFTTMICEAMETQNPAFQLFFIVIICAEQPDKAAILAELEKKEILKKRAAYIDKLRQVPDNDIIDWLEQFITTVEFSAALYEEYFSDKSKDLYTMQEVNLKLSEIIEDLEKGSDRIKRYL